MIQSIRPGEELRYPGTRRRYVVQEVRPWSVVFACGHWCTDTVVPDLIRVRTNRRVADEPPTLWDQPLTDFKSSTNQPNNPTQP